MRFPIALFLSLVVVFPAVACLNEFGTGTNLKEERFELMGGTLSTEDYVASLVKSPARSTWLARKSELEKLLADSPTFEQRNDYGAALIRLGDYEKARILFEELERTSPGNYSTAANLGTAYELLGQPAKAMEWIKEGVRRNPRSHEGTEWLHVKILEAKMALAGQPDWLKTHSVAGIDFGAESAPATPSLPRDFRGHAKTIELVRDAIFYQLHERLYFVSAPEPIVADLLFDLGNCLAHTVTLEHALAVYDLSLRFGPDKPVAQRRNHLQSGIRRATVKAEVLDRIRLVALLVALALFVVLIVLGIRRAVRRRRVHAAN